MKTLVTIVLALLVLTLATFSAEALVPLDAKHIKSCHRLATSTAGQQSIYRAKDVNSITSHLKLTTLANYGSTTEKRSMMSLCGKDTNDDDDNLADNFDAAGFAGYLAPYALALVVSVLAFGVFFKFVLMDY